VVVAAMVGMGAVVGIVTMVMIVVGMGGGDY
jgi:hypothetical protein